MIVYFIKCNDYVKIGQTKNHIKARMSAIQSCNPYKLELLLATSIYDNEGDLQGMFTKYWVRGEWYKLSEEILEFIKNKKAKKI